MEVAKLNFTRCLSFDFYTQKTIDMPRKQSMTLGEQLF